jgi:hypothetical protein
VRDTILKTAAAEHVVETVNAPCEENKARPANSGW